MSELIFTQKEIGKSTLEGHIITVPKSNEAILQNYVSIVLLPHNKCLINIIYNGIKYSGRINCSESGTRGSYVQISYSKDLVLPNSGELNIYSTETKDTIRFETKPLGTDYYYKTNLKSEIVLPQKKESIVNEEKNRIIGRNIILYGVPGSGKSFAAKRDYCKADTVVERVVFHPDYSYSDFVGQIMPTVNESNQIEYKYTAGPFTRILKQAIENPDLEHVLIIEEINRGNAPAIFGEVFQLLDRNADGQSEYGITNSDIAKVVYNGDSNRKVLIPSNLTIVATMNTSDQNVFTLDTAFQRRWNMRLIENSFDNADYRISNAKILDTNITWKYFCEEINKLISDNSTKIASTEDKRLGVYFIKISDLAMPANNDPNAKFQLRYFPEKVIKYLWDDAFKYNRDVLFDSEYKTLEKIVKAFVTKRGINRFDIFNENIREIFNSVSNNPNQGQ